MIGQLFAAFDSAWRVLIIGVILGAGVPILVAFAVKALAWGAGGEAELLVDGEPAKAHWAGKTIATAIFAIVILIVLAGIAYITAHGLGWVVTFEGMVPKITHK
ncbi:MAG: hypothetical protein LBU38_07790 [Propionibacteriaceae bacterium]|jgi:cytochrome b561|nr:hypothetical protein [Propionibacteriaceae bacterium]